jgi:CheY-like chemotaxis protein
LKPSRVIVVDDEEDVAGYLATALEDAGFEVRSFTEAAPALDEIERDPPDLVCLDLLMPGHTGLWIYRRLRQANGLSRIPVLVVTGLGMRKGLASLPHEDEAEPVPEPEAWIEKPVDLPRFLAAVRRLTSAGGAP